MREKCRAQMCVQYGALFTLRRLRGNRYFAQGKSIQQMILMSASFATDATNNRRMVTNTNFVLNRSDANTRQVSLRSYQYMLRFLTLLHMLLLLRVSTSFTNAIFPRSASGLKPLHWLRLSSAPHGI